MKILLCSILFILSLCLINFSSSAITINTLSSSKILDYGTYVYLNGDEYVGFFKDNKFHGQGTFTWIQGESFSGLWENGYMTEKGTYTYQDGTIEDFSETLEKWNKIKE
ncbi:hypothetical protein N9Y50_01785 [Alphaproteobacteria bacterium]|nr:hypothetical protein [Alphaproteobacteria bacterium]